MIRFTVPGQPQGKGRPKVVKIAGFTRMATPAKTVAYEGLIAHAAQQAMAGRPLLQGAVSLSLVLACQIPASWSQLKRQRAQLGIIRPTTKPDADNVVKAVCDGCNGVAWRDDVQVVDLSVSKVYSLTPGVTAVIQEVPGCPT